MTLFNCKTIEDIDKAIKNGADINVKDLMFGQTYLHVLVQTNDPKLDYFLTKNPNAEIRDCNNKTPLVYSKDLETFEKILKHCRGIEMCDLKYSIVIKYFDKLKKKYL